MDGSATFTTTASSVTMKGPSTAAVSARPRGSLSRAAACPPPASGHEHRHQEVLKLRRLLTQGNDITRSPGIRRVIRA